MKTALIVVDIQKFFLVTAPDDLVPNIAQHIKEAAYDCVAFVTFQNTSNSNFVRSISWPKCSTPEDTVLPTEFEFAVTADNVFRRDKYSGFSGTGLHEFLQKSYIEKVVLCGVDTEACVLATAFSAFDNGYMIDVNFDLTYSGGDLEGEAQAIMKRSLIAR